MRFDVPIGLADPTRRIEEIHHRATRQRDERSLPYTQLIAGRLARAALRMAYGFGPTIGAAVNVTLLTCVDTCALGINVDAGAIPDFDLFHDCLVDGFDEVLALVG